ncbi:13505_t:CDS:1 [Acaulospora colombiana]|uniref:13505_t:CDS:1 n=1 Tax=Acaulospora colombiana TaxID=27376 RepID=A0ACA9N9F9_9GLOM|nr:13505_t:CDS:1 [Acaulospora colombiana]
MLNDGFSRELCEKFRDGFPDDWKETLLREFTGDPRSNSTRQPTVVAHDNEEENDPSCTTVIESFFLSRKTVVEENGSITVAHEEIAATHDKQSNDAENSRDDIIGAQSNGSDDDNVDRDTILCETMEPVIFTDSILDESTQDAKDVQNVQDIQDVQNEQQDTQDLQQEAQDLQKETQDVQQDIQEEAHDSRHDAQDIQQCAQDIIHDIKDVQDVQDIQCLRGVQGVQDTQNTQLGNKRFGRNGEKNSVNPIGDISKKGSKVVAISSFGRRVRKPGSWWAVNPESNQEMEKITSKKRTLSDAHRGSVGNLTPSTDRSTGKRQCNEESGIILTIPLSI